VGENDCQESLTEIRLCHTEGQLKNCHDENDQPDPSPLHPCTPSRVRHMEEFLRLMTFGMPPNQRRIVLNSLWRVFVSAHIALACGWLSVTGFPGFAKADDVEKLKRGQVAAAAEVVAQNIFDTRVRQCQASTPESRQFYAARLQNLLTRYVELTAREYSRVPTCGEL
jgi:hypothetical protein